MNQEQVQQKLELIQQLFSDYRFNQNHNEVYAYCPQCNHHKQKLVISLEKDLFHCWICNYGGHVSKLIRVYGSDALYREWQRITGAIDFEYDLRDFLSGGHDTQATITRVKLPPEARRLKNGIPSVVAQNALKFLAKRGVTYRTIRMFNFYYCEEGKYRDRVLLPSYDINGKLNFFVARSIYDSSEIMKYINPQTNKEEIIFNELFITWERPIILVEGPFDALAVRRNAVPLLGSSLSEKSNLFRRIANAHSDVVLMLDNDQAGRAGTIKAGKLLTDWGINTSIVEYAKKDPGEMTPAEISAALKSRKPFTQSDVMRRILE